MSSPLLETSIDGAKGILFNITAGKDITGLAPGYYVGAVLMLVAGVIAIFLGVLIGTYSSIYVALPVILLWGVRRSDDESTRWNTVARS